MPDDLSPLKEPTFATALNDLDELLMQSSRAFLIGAGCSKCAGLPLMAELTAKTLASAKLSAITITILSAIEGLFAGADAANIEDYLSELVDLVAIAERRVVRGATRSGFKSRTPYQILRPRQTLPQNLAHVAKPGRLLKPLLATRLHLPESITLQNNSKTRWTRSRRQLLK